MRKTLLLVSLMTLFASAAGAQTYYWDRSTLSVTEGDGPITVNLLRDGPAAEAKTVYISDSSFNAERNKNYVVSPLAVTFQPAETSKAVELMFPENGRYESAKNLTLSISSNSQVSVGTPASLNVTINENDLAAYISFAGFPYDAHENAGPIPITIVRTGDTSGTSQVWFHTQDWSPYSEPISGQDYVAINQVVTFGPGETEKVVPLVIIDDDVYEIPVAPIMLALKEPMAGQGTLNAALKDPYSAMAQIIENDPASPATVYFANPAYSVVEGGIRLNFTIEVSGGSPGTEMAVTISTSAPDNPSLPIATPSVEYTPVNDRIFIGANSSKPYSIFIGDDVVTETSEYFQINLSDCGNCQLGTNSKATVEIVDNDGPPFVNFAPTQYSIAENDPAGGVDVTIVRGAPATAQCTVTMFTQAMTANSSDYTNINQLVVFAAGETSKTVRIPIINNAVAEGDEQFTVTVWRPQNCTVVEPSHATVTIVDDDTVVPPPAPPQVFEFAQSHYSFSEGETTTVTVRRTSGIGQQATITVTTPGGDPFDDRVLTFGANDTQKSFSVTIPDDDVAEAAVHGELTIDNGPVRATYTVEASDLGGSAVSFRLSSRSYTVDESVPRVIVTVQRLGDTSGADGVLLATRAATAEAGVDYVTLRRTIEFAPGQSEQDVELRLVADTSAEPRETFEVTLDGSDAGVVTITDDDTPAPRTLQFASGDATLTLDFHEPLSGGDLSPLILWIDSDGSEVEAVRQLDRGHAVLVLRLRDESYPRSLADVIAAIQWLRDGDRELALDLSRLVVWGQGSGGFAAAHAATSGWAQGAIVWSAPSDLTAFLADSTCGADSGIPLRILGCLPEQCPAEAALANPAVNASASDGPFLIMHGEADCEVPVAQARRLATALTNAGADVTLRTYPGVSHEDAFWGSSAASAEVEAFLARVKARPVRRRSVR